MKRVFSAGLVVAVLSCASAGSAIQSEADRTMRSQSTAELTRPGEAYATLSSISGGDESPRGASRIATDTQLPDSLPRELVEALMGTGVRIAVGVPADVFPAELFAGSRVLGTRRLGPTSTTVFVMPFNRSQALDTVAVRLTALGWSPPPQSSPQPLMRGFQSSQASPGPRAIFCKGREQVIAGPSTRGAARTVMAVTHVRDQRGGACVSSEIRNFLDQSPIPTLTAPSGASVQGGGSGGGGDEFYTSARLNDADSVRETLKHYVDQLKQAGWTPIDENTVAGIAIATFNIRDAEGVSWFGTFSILSPDESGRSYLRFATTRR